LILLIALVAGLVAGWLRASWNKRAFQSIHLKFWWLVILAFVPQLVAFQWKVTSASLSVTWAAVALVSSQVLLLIFVWFNRRDPRVWILGSGLLLNLMVILLNGGLMPISPDTVQKLIPNAPAGSWQIGARLGTGKDIVLPILNTRLWFLSDHFLLPAGLHYQVAFSLGDVLIAIGAFWLLWSLGGPLKLKEVEV
jgi:heme/copper-type cytochrome/quinol oxidase subunit 4